MSTPRQVAGAVTGISDSTQGVSDILGRLGTGSFWDQLQPASFRGVPFGVFTSGGQAGRRNAEHEYPNRDVGWVEDLGRSQRRFQVTGFVVGDDVIAQRQRMLDAVERAGDGDVVLPTFGRIKVALVGFDWEERAEKGRVIEYRFAFVRQGQRQYPGSPAITTAQVASGVALFGSATAAAFVARTASVLGEGAGIANRATQQAAAWAQQAVRVGNDATSLIRLAVSLPGQFGRLLGLASGVTVGQVLPQNIGLTEADLVGAAAQSRAAIATACASLVQASATIAAGATDTFTGAAQAVVAAIRAAAPTPGDALRGLQTLATYVPVAGAAGDEAVMQGACADLFRRAALGGLVSAGTDYQPQSSGDAAAVRTLVLDVLDAEITTAGDQFEDDVYAALRALRGQAVQDLNSRGAQLPTLITVTMPASLPSLVLAQRLYRDATRETELVARAVPIHPAFMPRTFEALNQ
jgi:prophage DNA circulation protein